ncbi:MAG: AAA family ATPase [Candidatus Eisenbacteria sp.]|nr:AAA family ATPase [Candidatus Eisenbacteria bacterium]
MSEIHDKDKQLYTIQDLLSWTPPKNYRIISGGVLNVKNRMIIFGDEGSWKSMLALHTANCIARGSKWLGFRTNPCNVLRLQVELPMYMDRERIDKYCVGSKTIFLAKDEHKEVTSNELDRLDNRAIDYAYPLVVSRTEQFIHIDESSGWESLRKNIQTCIETLPPLPLLVILDPLFKMFNRDLSSELDVKPMLDKIDLIMEDASQSIPGLSFIIIHHTRKSKTDEQGNPIQMGSQDATGSRALLRWADTILRIDPSPKDSTLTQVNATFTKHRNAEDVLPRLVLRWSRDTLHPQILSRIVPKYEEEEEMELRGELDLGQLE